MDYFTVDEFNIDHWRAIVGQSGYALSLVPGSKIWMTHPPCGVPVLLLRAPDDAGASVRRHVRRFGHWYPPDILHLTTGERVGLDGVFQSVG